MTRTVINDLSISTAFDQTTWVEGNEEVKVEVCSIYNGNGVLLQTTKSQYPLVVPRENLAGLISMLLSLAERLEEE